MLLKVLVFLYIYVWFRATLPRLRYDQLMNLGWRLMIPLALGWFMLLAAFRIGKDEGWNRWFVGAVCLAVVGGGASLLGRATKVSASDSTVVMCSTVTTTGWRSASAASCAPVSARLNAFMCAVPTTIR